MDSFNYKYNIGTNQLNHVSDNVPDGDYAFPGYEDTDGQGINNYTYDPIGNLITDVSENITNISWNVYGKITLVNYSNTTSGTIKNVYYFYDAAGNRMGKRAEKNYSGGTSNTFTWYVRDASGNVMAVYSSTASNNSNPTNLTLKERNIYGSSRLGIFTLNKDVKASMPSYTLTTGYKSSFTRGYKYYELSNHLGNILGTVSDRKIGVDNNSDGKVDYYDADLLSATDYMPFGSALPGRSFGSSAYRYSFNGKEKDKDGTGQTVQYDYGFRIYDPHLGRFKSVDPLQKKFPELTPYQFASNSPIANVDLDGREAEYYTQTITFITVNQKLPNGEYKVSQTQEVYSERLKTGFFPNGPLGSGTLYTVQTQLKEVFLGINGNPEAPPCYEPLHVLKRFYKFSDNDLSKEKRPMFKGKFQLMVFGSAHDDSDGPGSRPNPNAQTAIIDMNKFKEFIEPVLIGIRAKIPPEAPELTDILGSQFDNAIDKLNKEAETTVVCPGCHSGDTQPAYGADAYLLDAKGKVIDTLKKNPTTGKTDTLPVKEGEQDHYFKK